MSYDDYPTDDTNAGEPDDGPEYDFDYECDRFDDEDESDDVDDGEGGEPPPEPTPEERREWRRDQESVESHDWMPSIIGYDR